LYLVDRFDQQDQWALEHLGYLVAPKHHRILENLEHLELLEYLVGRLLLLTLTFFI
jgi:hypothetical protein